MTTPMTPTPDTPRAALENDIRELRGAAPGELARRLIERGWSRVGGLQEAADELARNPSVLVSRDAVVAALRQRAALQEDADAPVAPKAYSHKCDDLCNPSTGYHCSCMWTREGLDADAPVGGLREQVRIALIHVERGGCPDRNCHQTGTGHAMSALRAVLGAATSAEGNVPRWVSDRVRRLSRQTEPPEPELFDCPECDHEVALGSAQFHAPRCTLGARARPAAEGSEG